MARLLLLTIALIVYGSLYPWHLRPLPAGQDPLSILLHSWSTDALGLTIRDIAVNVIVYLPLGLFAFATFNSIWRSLLLGFTLSTFVELAQVFIVGRVPSMLDVVSDTLGTGIGIAAGVLWAHTRHRPAQRADAALLISFWILYQCFPFLPRLHRPSVVMRSPPEDVLLFVAEAITLVLLVKNRSVLLGILLLLVPLKALIYTRTATLPEIICSAAIFVLARWIPVRASAAAPLLGCAIVVRGLAPYHFLSQPHGFAWLPFQASFTSEWEPALTVMLSKIFPYGALLWLIRESGVRLVNATVITAALLAAIEIVQMYLPGRSSEIIDPLIALILGWVFWSLEDV